jgi:hypothetical protein
VQDVIDLAEHLEHFRPQQTVGVRDHPDPHRAPVERPSQRSTSEMSISR